MRSFDSDGNTTLHFQILIGFVRNYSFKKASDQIYFYLIMNLEVQLKILGEVFLGQNAHYIFLNEFFSYN